MVFAAFWACYHSNFCCVPWFSKILAALHITFVPSFPSGEGWAGGLVSTEVGGPSLWQCPIPGQGSCRGPCSWQQQGMLALLCSPSWSFFHKHHLTTPVDCCTLGLAETTSLCQPVWAAPHCCFSTFSPSAPCSALPKRQALLWEQRGEKEQGFQDLSPSSVFEQPGWAASISPTERNAEPQNHGRQLQDWGIFCLRHSNKNLEWRLVDSSLCFFNSVKYILQT